MASSVARVEINSKLCWKCLFPLLCTLVLNSWTKFIRKRREYKFPFYLLKLRAKKQLSDLCLLNFYYIIFLMSINCSSSSSVIFANLIENLFSEIKKSGVDTDNNRKLTTGF